MSNIEFDHATCLYEGATQPSVTDLSLHIDDGEFMVLVGPSGCGKTTALRMLAGLEKVASGMILIDEADVSGKAPKDRDLAMVFQSYALYPHMTVRENMAFALKLTGISKVEQVQRVDEVAKLLELERFLDRKPKALSGGQRQRVAMGRAIVREPKAFLMDEPLSNLDAKLRVETRASIAALQSRLGTTTLYVTHDQVEAMTMGDRVAVMRDGVLQQVDTPHNLYDHPVNAFVAGFIGSPEMNMRTADIDDDVVQLGNVSIRIPSESLAAAKQLRLQQVLVGVRPEAFDGLAGDDGGGDPSSTLRLKVRLVEELGADAYVYGQLPSDEPDTKSFAVRLNDRNTPRPGDSVSVTVPSAALHVFDPETGLRLG